MEKKKRSRASGGGGAAAAAFSSLLFVFVLLLVAAAAPEGAAGFALTVKDGGCEGSLSSNWSPSAGSSWSCSGSAPPRTGTGRFTPLTSATVALHQDVDITEYPQISSGKWAIRFAHAAYSLDGLDSCFMAVEPRNAADQVLGGAVSTVASTSTRWVQRWVGAVSGSPAIAAGATKLRARMTCTHVSGTHSGVVDDVVVGMVPFDTAEMVVNGGCESGTASGWTGTYLCSGTGAENAGLGRTFSALNGGHSSPAAIEGTAHIRPSQAGQTKTITQTINLAAVGGLTAAIDQHKASFHWDGFYRVADVVNADTVATLELRAKNSGGTVIKTTTFTSGESPYWKYASTGMAGAIAPALTRTVDIVLSLNRGSQDHTYQCNPYNCNPYNCNPYNCFPYDCNCGLYSCNTCWQTCYNTCYQTCYQTCTWSSDDSYAYFDHISLRHTTHDESICDGDATVVTLSGANSGTILDAFGNYGNGWTCNWAITTASSAGQVIVTFLDFDTDANDVVTVYSNNDFTSPIGGTLSGAQTGATKRSTVAGKMSIRFQSDGSINRKGFRGYFEYVPFPAITNVNPAGGVAGTVIVITGTNMPSSVGNAKVMLGSTACTVTQANGATVTCIAQTPPVSGQVVVTVSNRDVPSQGSASTFVYVDVPVLSSVDPPGGINRAVTLYGNNFGTSTSNIVVEVQNSAGTFVLVSSIGALGSSGGFDTLVVTLPSCPDCGDKHIRLYNYGIVSSNTVAYKYILLPVFSSIVADRGKVGQEVTIAGSSFGTVSPLTASVVFNDGPTPYQATISAVTPTQIICVVPSGPSPGTTVNVRVHRYQEQSAATRTFEYVPIPVVTSANPSGGTPSTVLTLGGSNLGTSAGNVQVFFTDQVSSFVTEAPSLLTVASNQITLNPPSMSEGVKNIKVCNFGECSVAPWQTFAFVAGLPEVTGFSPVGGAVGTTVTVVGSGFGSSPGLLTVTLVNGGTTSNCVVSSSGFSGSQFNCVVQDAVPANFYNIRVQRFSTETTSTDTFHYVITSITSVTPQGGPAGLPITIAGSFGTIAPHENDLNVKIGPSSYCSVDVPSLTSAQVICTLPVSGLPLESPQDVRIEWFGVLSTEASARTFTVISPLATSSLTPGGGLVSTTTSVIISGSGFGSTPSQVSVAIGSTGQSCAVTGVSSNTINCDMSSSIGTPGLHNIQVTRFATNAAAPLPTYRYLNAIAFRASNPVIPAGGSTTGGNPVTIYGQTNFGSGCANGDFQVQIGGSICPIASVDAGCTYVVCTAPSKGTGTYAVTLKRFAVSATGTANYDFVVAPSIATVSPSFGQALTGTLVTMSGSNLGNNVNDLDVTIGGQDCTGLALVAGDTSLNQNNRFTCTTPTTFASGLRTVIVDFFGVLSSFPRPEYEYVGAPSIDSVSPLGCLTTGGMIVQLNGLGFGDDPQATVTIGGASCAIQAGSLTGGGTGVRCQAPARSVGTYDVIATRFAQTSTESPHKTFAYVERPTLVSVSPPTSKAGEPLVVEVSFTGGSAAHVTMADYFITVGGGACAVTGVTGSGATRDVTCTIPPGLPGVTSVNLRLFSGVGTGSVTATNSLTFQFSNDAAVSTFSPGGGVENDILTVYGGGFGVFPNSLLTVRLGGPAGSVCPVLSITDSGTVLTCRVPAGSGSGVVYVDNTASTATSTEQFHYILVPSVTGTSPGGGKIGDLIDVTGANLLSPVPGQQVTILFGGVAATISSVVNAGLVQVFAPSTSGIVPVTARLLSAESNDASPPNFEYVGLIYLSGSTPVGGSVPRAVTLSGFGFGTSIANLAVTVGGLSCANVRSLTDVQLVCDAPAALSLGKHHFEVAKYGVPALKPFDITYERIAAPAVTSVFPVGGAAASIVTVTGTGFGTAASGATTAQLTATIGGVTAQIVLGSLDAAGTSIRLVVPAGTGVNRPVQVTRFNMPSNTDQTFTYAARPTLTGVVPEGGAIAGNTFISVSGTGFGTNTADLDVYLDGVLCTGLTIVSDVLLTCNTPNLGATERVADLYVVRFDVLQTPTALDYLYIGPPQLFSLAPAAGIGGTAITITGNGFGTTASVLSISLNGAVACPIVAGSLAGSGGRVICTIPSSGLPASPPASLTVTMTRFGVASTGTITYALIDFPSITSIDPPVTFYTQEITIAGQNFGTSKLTTELTFDDVSANAPIIGSIITLTSTEIIATVPAVFPGNVDVVVSNYGVASSASSFEVVAFAQITDVSPIGGVIGTTVTISGVSFVNTETVVEICGQTATIVEEDSVGRSYVIVTAPDPLTPLSGGKLDCVVRVEVVGVYSVNSDTFRYVELPQVTAVEPLGGEPLQLLTLTGVYFGAVEADLAVTVGGNPAFIVAESLESTGTRIVVVAPDNGGTYGPEEIVIRRFDDVVSTTTVDFEYIRVPVITLVSPAGGSELVGTILTISGRNFGQEDQLTIEVGNPSDPPKNCPIVPASFTDVGGNQTVQCTLPAGLLGRRAVVVARFLVRSVGNAASWFEYVNKPVTSSGSPTGGAVGATVVVSGLNFGQDIAALKVWFRNGTDLYQCPVVTDTLNAAGTQVGCTAPIIGGDIEFTGTVDVFVSVFGIDSDLSFPFEYVEKPILLDVNPPGGVEGQSITVTGILPADAVESNVAVVVGSAECVISNIVHQVGWNNGSTFYPDADDITCFLKADVLGATTIKLFYFGIQADAQLPFEYALQPFISGIVSSPPEEAITQDAWQTLLGSQVNSGATGREIRILGSNFGQDLSSLSVTFSPGGGSAIEVECQLSGDRVESDADGNDVIRCIVPDLTTFQGLGASVASCPAGGPDNGVIQVDCFVTRFGSLESNIAAFFFVIDSPDLLTSTPESSAVGDNQSPELEITGQNFGLCTSAFGVLIGTGDSMQAATVVEGSLTATSVRAVIAADFFSGVEGLASMRARRWGVFGNVSVQYPYLRRPRITEMLPAGGSEGSLITVTGELFGADEDQLEFIFSNPDLTTQVSDCVVVPGSLTAPVVTPDLYYNDTQLTVRGLQTVVCTLSAMVAYNDPWKVQVVRQGVTSSESNLAEFKYVNVPKLIDISPRGGKIGSTRITIAGDSDDNFGSSTDIIDVSIAGIPCNIPRNDSLNAGGTLLLCDLGTHVNASQMFEVEGRYPVEVSVYGVPNVFASGIVTFQFIDTPIIFDITPKGGRQGQQLTITGRNFGNASTTTVYLGDANNECTVDASDLNASPQVVYCTMREALQTGVFTIDLFNYEERAIFQNDLPSFEYVEAPDLEEIDPVGGVPGTRISIIGTGYGVTASELSVSFIDTDDLGAVSQYDCPVVTTDDQLRENPESIKCKVEQIPGLSASRKMDVVVRRFAAASAPLEGAFTYVPPSALEYVVFFEGASVFFIILSFIGICLALFFAFSLNRYDYTPLVKSSSPLFSYLIIFGTIVGFTGIIIQAGRPSEVLCTAQVWLPGLAFSIVFSNIFVKTWRIWRIYDTKAIRKVVISDRDLLMSSSSLVLIEAIGLGFWSYADPIHDEVQFGDPSRAICTSRDRSVYLLAQEGWKLLNLVFGVFLVWQTRNVVSRFNESKDIGFAMYNYFAATLMSAVFLALLTQGSEILYGLRALCELVALYGTLLILFARKIYLLWKHDGDIPGMEDDMHSENSMPSMATQDESSASFGRIAAASGTLGGSGSDSTDLSTFDNPMFADRPQVRDLDNVNDFWD